ncbi:MAG: hypothetical protein M1816_003013 [Peltula sp. TS41687]|nr:MAG: hypothetical protein M1816_003013 [Peltula sp. TS41687]
MTSETNIASSADFVIVGGGTAGLVVANRLSEDPNVSVLVLEAGQSRIDDPRVQIPALWTSMMGTEVDWQLSTVPQPGLNGRTIKEPQGKMLGGSSALNGQAFIAPSQAGIDAWAKLGNPSWTWASLLPYYKKFYTLHLPDQPTRDHLGLDWIDESVRGTTGPIQASFPGVIQNPIAKAWVDTFKTLQYNTTGDPFSGKSVGGYSNAAAIDPKTQTRSYSATQYGVPASKRPNVHIVTDATVRRILFQDESSSAVTASGVEVMVGEKMQTIQASKEVILCAGVFHTPKLLELSGIGNKSLLEQFGIPVVIDNPGVGENMQDHLMTGVSFEVVEGVPTGDPLMRQEPDAIQAAMQMYAEHKAGPMCVGGVASSAFMPLMDSTQQQELMDTHLPLDDANDNTDSYQHLIRSIIASPDEASSTVFMFLAQANLHEQGKSFIGQQLQAGNFASLGCMQSHPFSRGRTHISSRSFADPPTIDPRYFSHPLDLEIMARHLQSIETIRATEPLARFFKPDGKRNHPDAWHVRDLDAAKKYLRDTALTSYHNCGTAAMLPREKGGVVDERLVVHGTTNLRIVDASVFPLIPRANPMSTVYAVAEKAADIIKGV